MLRIENLKKNYQDFTLDCSLEVKSGQITGLIGRNGAGKSTTFKAILGLISMDAGNIYILNRAISAGGNGLTRNEREKIGVVLSDSGFNELFTIRDILPIASSLYSTFDADTFAAKAEEYKLPLNKKIKEFSTGMKAKLKLLFALSHDAKLLILDEPTAGLDIVARNELLNLLRDYLAESEDRCILISSHILSDLETICDDIYIIDDGKIILHEDTDVLLSDYAILKMDSTQFASLDKSYIFRTLQEGYGYRCLTAEKQFYIDNYPEIVVENGSIDDVTMLMIKGE